MSEYDDEDMSSPKRTVYGILPVNIATISIDDPCVIDQFLDLPHKKATTAGGEIEITNSFLLLDDYPEFKEELNKYVREYANMFLSLAGTYEIANSWHIKLQPGNSLLEEPDSNSSIIMGILYTNVIDDHDCTILTRKPVSSHWNIFPAIEKSQYSSDPYTSVIPAKNGTLLLFPSYLKHSVNGVTVSCKDRGAIYFTVGLARR
jgi:hypothetical protein